MRMRLGLFDGNTSKLEYGDINGSHVCSEENLDLALESARSGIVLLKNENGLLPLSKKDTKLLAVISPNANNSDTFLGDYESPTCKNISILQALQNYDGVTAEYHKGCNYVPCSQSSIDEAEIAKRADYVVLIVGMKGRMFYLGLPGGQDKVAVAVAAATKRPW